MNKKASESISTTITSIPVLVLLLFGLLIFGIFTSVLASGKKSSEIYTEDSIQMENQRELIGILNYCFENGSIKDGIIRWSLNKNGELEKKLEETIKGFFSSKCEYLFCAQFYGSRKIDDRIIVGSGENLNDFRCEEINEEGVQKLSLFIGEEELNFYYYEKC